MIKIPLRSFLMFLVLPALSLHAQYFKTHQVNLSAGAFGQFSTILTDSPQPTIATAPFTILPVAATDQQQFTANSVGMLASMQFHPVPWAGVEINYGFTHYRERFVYTDLLLPSVQLVDIPTNSHEFTGAYLFHPKRIPFQPFLGIGGGAIDFDPNTLPAESQWRGAGLVEMGFDMTPKSSPLGFRIEGRSLIYRSPNFGQPAISTRSWRSTEEPVVSVF